MYYFCCSLLSSNNVSDIKFFLVKIKLVLLQKCIVVIVYM